jgi:hypothetical protein
MLLYTWDGERNMKTSSYIGIALLAILIVVCVVGWNSANNKANGLIDEVVALNSQAVALNESNAKLVQDNVALQKISNLKSFENTKALERFLKEAKSISEYKNDYASVACINLMREAKEKGYWMGITGVNTTDENYFKAMLRERKGIGQDVTWHCFNVAIVGDGDLYLVDTSDSSYLFVVTIRGDFADYSGLTNEATNLKLK